MIYSPQARNLSLMSFSPSLRGLLPGNLYITLSRFDWMSEVLGSGVTVVVVWLVSLPTYTPQTPPPSPRKVA